MPQKQGTRLVAPQVTDAATRRYRPKKACAAVIAALVIVSIAGCATTAQNVGLGLGAATVAGSRSASSELQQTYYLGSFDTYGQIPPQVYRIRVHGQASLLGFTKFASGWVPAQLADSLGGGINFKDNTAETQLTSADSSQAAAITSSRLITGRRLILFGPEGFREAPANYRLVIVMGSDPSAYFDGVSNALGGLAQANYDKNNQALDRMLFESLVTLHGEDQQLRELSQEVNIELPVNTGATP